MERYGNDDFTETGGDREEVYSKVVKAGKRTYFMDVRATVITIII